MAIQRLMLRRYKDKPLLNAMFILKENKQLGQWFNPVRLLFVNRSKTKKSQTNARLFFWILNLL